MMEQREGNLQLLPQHAKHAMQPPRAPNNAKAQLNHFHLDFNWHHALVTI